jgi:hypothetical protein
MCCVALDTELISISSLYCGNSSPIRFFRTISRLVSLVIRRPLNSPFTRQLPQNCETLFTFFGDRRLSFPEQGRCPLPSEVAKRLDINLTSDKSDRKIRGQVIGGQVIEAHVITLNSLTIGPHTKSDIPITVIRIRDLGSYMTGF